MEAELVKERANDVSVFYLTITKAKIQQINNNIRKWNDWLILKAAQRYALFLDLLFDYFIIKFPLSKIIREIFWSTRHKQRNV
jgi:hypothetical protein